MKLLSWMKDHLQTPTRRLRSSRPAHHVGLEVENIDGQGEGAGRFTIARVIFRRAATQCGSHQGLHGDPGNGRGAGAGRLRRAERAYGLVSVSPARHLHPGKGHTPASATIRGVREPRHVCSAAERQISEVRRIMELPDEARLAHL